MKKDERKFLFVGNRYYVLKKMIELNLNVTEIYAVRDSYLAKMLEKEEITYRTLGAKKQFIDEVKMSDFDVLVSNGLPYILPVSSMKKDSQTFVNIHPSLLPDLKGTSPINGAILFQRGHGVTCHLINDEIDGGDILAQIKIDNAKNFPLDLLYQVSFREEGQVFEEAYKNGFIPIEASAVSEPIYYSKKRSDAEITFLESFDELIHKIRAFSSPGQYAYIKSDKEEINVLAIDPIESDFLDQRYMEYPNKTNIFQWDTETLNILIKYDDKFCVLRIEYHQNNFEIFK
ncbi:formyltransferase family protein [Enterococcus pseudoavium]|uniref:formyltransferase family protein n=1 Tax=Enterococcus pseudoavium TaxID=44007 RepID=UPI00082FFCF8|nr:formyltransferase family protein [Enterococcus pseudoavium]REC32409.1 hypothetical protein CF160_08070 [Enterococcus pseudoavium]